MPTTGFLNAQAGQADDAHFYQDFLVTAHFVKI